MFNSRSHRPLQRPAREPAASPDRPNVGNKPPVQRLLLNLDATNPQAIRNLEHLQANGGVEMRSGDVNDLQDNEVLHLVAHANKRRFGNFDAPGLFEHLVEQGLPGNVGGIQLHGCESMALAAQLQALLNKAALNLGWDLPERPIAVGGIPGYYFADEEGQAHTVGTDGGNDAVWKVHGQAIASKPTQAVIEDLRQKDPAPAKALRPVQTLRTDPNALRKHAWQVWSLLNYRLSRLPRDLRHLDYRDWRHEVNALAQSLGSTLQAPDFTPVDEVGRRAALIDVVTQLKDAALQAQQQAADVVVQPPQFQGPVDSVPGSLGPPQREAEAMPDLDGSGETFTVQDGDGGDEAEPDWGGSNPLFDGAAAMSNPLFRRFKSSDDGL